MGMGTGGMGGAEGQKFSQGWQFRSSIDPEELFRKIFGDAGFRSGGFGTEFEDFAESSFGFGSAQEVSKESEIFRLCSTCHGSVCEGVICNTSTDIHAT
jgi:hypothetical protein